MSPLKRKVPIKPRKNPLYRKPQGLTPRDLQYLRLKEEYLTEHSKCQARLKGCTSAAVDIHHVLGRGKYLLVTASFMAVCRFCHEQVHKLNLDYRHLLPPC